MDKKLQELTERFNRLEDELRFKGIITDSVLSTYIDTQTTKYPVKTRVNIIKEVPKLEKIDLQNDNILAKINQIISKFSK